MPRYLLAAEADKIQDFIFRSAKLREVVGGSRLLARFCSEGVKELRKKHDNKPEVLISDGGAFRIVFDDEITARDFGNDLAELYLRCAGGVLTVADPVEYDDSNDERFKKCYHAAQEQLRSAKSRGDKAATAVHLPYTAFCASCGVGLASGHRKKNESDTRSRANYLCADCRNKTEEKFDQDRIFIGAFGESLLKELGDTEKLPQIKFELNDRDWVDLICKADARSYVAYLLADGNGMGQLFSQCNRTQLEYLSKELTNSLRHSLAKPCATMIRSQGEALKVLEGKLPVVPLILGGDDLFALLPAPFALDFATEFCQIYEETMTAILARPETNLSDQPKPTITAAVVICKRSYPHTLAHQRAECALKQAKEMARRIEVTTGKRVSTLNFDVVTGNQVTADSAGNDHHYRASLRPYFISDAAPADWGINMQNLIEARVTLKALPAKRRSEFEKLYADLPDDKKKPTEEGDFRSRWKPQFEGQLKRLGVQDANSQEEDSLEKRDKLPVRVLEALKLLGGAQKESGYLRRVERAPSPDWYANGLSDLLEAWDFAFKLDKPMDEYWEE